MDVRYASHPDDVKNYDTETLREKFLIEKVFGKDEINLTYSHVDRIIAGGILPVEKELKLEVGDALGTDYFLERREMGIINIGGKGEVVLDGETFALNPKDGMYIGLGIKDVVFRSLDKNDPAKFYMNSAPAHKKYPTVKIDIDKANPAHMGDEKLSNKRTIYKYIDPSVCESCQLLMGMTILEPNNMWNTMPCHTHDRRMEVYFYFNLPEDQRVFHFMGKPDDTKHLVLANEQGAISPSWSIHSGVGTHNYTFIWGMVGENVNYGDMQAVKMEDLK